MCSLTRQNDKILDGIVTSIAIKMMHCLSWFERSSKVEFHDITMFQHMTTIYRNIPISILGGMPARPSWMQRAGPGLASALKGAVLLVAAGWIKGLTAPDAFSWFISMCHRQTVADYAVIVKPIDVIA